MVARPETGAAIGKAAVVTSAELDNLAELLELAEAGVPVVWPDGIDQVEVRQLVGR